MHTHRESYKTNLASGPCNLYTFLQSQPAPFSAHYEAAAKVYSTNQIRASKRFQLKYISPGDKVLYLGAGTGEDAVMAARHGAEVTCIDIFSQAMLDRVQSKLYNESLFAVLIQ